MKTALSGKKTYKYLPYAVIIISFVILLIRSFYSFCWSDETFYFSTADRFYKGDSIFLHDWFPTQLSGVFILPLYSLFVKITGGTSGVILFFRIVYNIFELIFGVIVFRLIKKVHGCLTALCISIFSMFYTHLNIATVSYYTMSVMFYLLSMIILYTFYMTDSDINSNAKNTDNTANNRLYLALAGICFAISVLNLPTMAAAYVLIVIGGFILYFIAKSIASKITPVIDMLRLPYIFKYTLAGIIIPAVMFMIYLFINVSIPDFIKSIPYVLSDDEHITSKLYPIRKMYLGIIESYGNKIFYLGCLITAAALVSWLLKCLGNFLKERHPAVSEFLDNFFPIMDIIIVIADIAAFILCFFKSFGHTGYIQTAIMMFALPLFFITNKKDIFAFILFFLSGITFSLVFSYSSNGMLYILAIGHFIASIGGIIFIKDFLGELAGLINSGNSNNIYKTGMKAVYAVIVLFVFTALAHTAVCRIVNVYRDDKLSHLTAAITEGPAKGLKTSPEHKQMYDEVYSVIEELCQKDDNAEAENLLISFLLPWGYLCTDLRVAAPTTWRNGMDSDRLREYYELNPDKKPDIILVLNDNYGTYETCGDVEYDPSPNANSADGFMYDYIIKEGFQKEAVACGTIYKKPH